MALEREELAVEIGAAVDACGIVDAVNIELEFDAVEGISLGRETPAVTGRVASYWWTMRRKSPNMWNWAGTCCSGISLPTLHRMTQG